MSAISSSRRPGQCSRPAFAACPGSHPGPRARMGSLRWADGLLRTDGRMGAAVHLRGSIPGTLSGGGRELGCEPHAPAAMLWAPAWDPACGSGFGGFSAAGGSFPCAGGRGAPAAGRRGAALLYPSANAAGVSPEGGEGLFCCRRGPRACRSSSASF